MSRALSAIYDIALRWFRYESSINRPTMVDAASGTLRTRELPTAEYDPVVHTFTCPHCGQTLPIAEWTLIEPGYERYWSLNGPSADDFGRVTASDDRFSDNGDDAPPRLVHESHDCYRCSLVPGNFEWDWN